ncbi:MAG: hypothetical protein ACI4TG_01770, partial [Ruminococcus sp.]
MDTAIQTAVANAGYTATDLTVTASGSTATIKFKIDSKNIEAGTNPPVATAEMSAVSIKFPFQLSNTTVDTTNFTTAGTVANNLKVAARPSGKTDYSYSLGDNTVSLKIPAPTPASFTLSKRVDNSKKYKPGEEVTFTISATNTGGKAAKLTVTDTVPAGLTVKDITSGNGTVNGNAIIFDNVAAGATVTATVVCTVNSNIDFGTDSSVWLTNTAQGTYDGKETSEVEASIEVEKVAPAVSYQKTGYTNSGSKYIQGQDTPVTYIITVKNSGNTAGQFEYSDDLSQADVTVTDESKISASVNTGTVPTGAFTLNGNTVSGSGTLEAGQVLTITVNGTLNTTESSVANALTRPDNGTMDTVDDNKTDETITFNGEKGEANVAYAKTGYVEGGGNTYTKGIATKVYYTITVKNTGNIEGTFSFEDVVDSRIQDVNYTAKLNGTDATALVSKTGNTITNATDATIPANSTLTIEITGNLVTTADDDGNVSNLLTGKPDTTVTFTGKDAAPNFVFEKTGQVGSGGNTYISGDGKEESATYTIKVTNNGTADGTIKFTDKMPDGVTLDAGQTFPDGVTANGNTITVEKELAVGDTLTITLNVTITDTATGNLSNTLTGIDAGSGTYGGDMGEVFYAEKATTAISASKSGDVGTGGNQYEVGDTVTYKITVTNSGNTAAKDVIVEDAQPDGIQFESYQVDNGEEQSLSGNLLYTIPEVAANGTCVITIKGKVVSIPTANDGKIVNIATVDGNNTGTVTFEPKKPDLSVHKYVYETGSSNTDKQNIDIVAGEAGQKISFVIRVFNAGSGAAKNLVITDASLADYIADGSLNVVNVSALERIHDDYDNPKTIAITYDQLVNGFLVETLEANNSIEITIDCETTDKVTSISNTATITADNQETNDAFKDTATAKQPVYSAEKWIVDGSGNRLENAEISTGQKLTYRAKFAISTSGDPIKDLYLKDASPDAMFDDGSGQGTEQFQVKIVDSNNSDLIGRVSDQSITSNGTPEWSIGRVKFTGINLQPGDWIVIEYSCYSGNGFNKASRNEIEYYLNDDNFKSELTGDGVYNLIQFFTTKPSGFDASTDYIAQDMIRNDIDNTVLNVTKTVDQTSIDLMQFTTEELEDMRFQYTVDVKGEGYTAIGDTIKVTDQLPEWMTLDKSVTPQVKQGYGNFEDLKYSYNPVANTVTFTLTSTVALDNQYTNGIQVQYTTKLDSNKINDLLTYKGNKIEAT